MELFAIVIFLLIVGIFIFRHKIMEHIKEPFRSFLPSSNMNLKLENMSKTVLIPIIVTVILYIFYVILFGFVYSPISDLTYTLVSIIIAPLSEQILQGYLIIGFFFIFAKVCKNKWIVGSFVLVLSALIMTAVHFSPNSTNLQVHFLSFVFYGAIYYIYNENLLPATIAHTTWNIIILNPIPF